MTANRYSHHPRPVLFLFGRDFSYCVKGKGGKEREVCSGRKNPFSYLYFKLSFRYPMCSRLRILLFLVIFRKREEGGEGKKTRGGGREGGGREGEENRHLLFVIVETEHCKSLHMTVLTSCADRDSGGESAIIYLL